MTKPVNFLSNKNLLAEIHASKKTYCEFLKGSLPTDFDYDLIMSDTDKLPESLPNGTVVRIMTDSHIQEFDRELVNFPPFIHVRYIEGQPRPVVRSHSKDGEFSTRHGTISRGLARAILLMVDKFGMKANWRNYSYRDEMEGAAIENLSRVCLRFNEARSQNPFAYYTSVMTMAFTRLLNKEKTQVNIKDSYRLTLGLDNVGFED